MQLVYHICSIIYIQHQGHRDGPLVQRVRTLSMFLFYCVEKTPYPSSVLLRIQLLEAGLKLQRFSLFLWWDACQHARSHSVRRFDILQLGLKAARKRNSFHLQAEEGSILHWVELEDRNTEPTPTVMSFLQQASVTPKIP